MAHFFKGKITKYSSRFGVGVTQIEDRTIGLAKIEDDLRYEINRLLQRTRAFLKKHLPKFPRARYYSNKVGDIWMKKYAFTEDQGLREQHNMFVSMEEQGKLYECNDREVWEPLRKRYGRNRVDTGSRKYSNTRATKPIITGI